MVGISTIRKINQDIREVLWYNYVHDRLNVPLRPATEYAIDEKMLVHFTPNQK
mgnify:CR=1 FL=1